MARGFDRHQSGWGNEGFGGPFLGGLAGGLLGNVLFPGGGGGYGGYGGYNYGGGMPYYPYPYYYPYNYGMPPYPYYGFY